MLEVIMYLGIFSMSTALVLATFLWYRGCLHRWRVRGQSRYGVPIERQCSRCREWQFNSDPRKYPRAEDWGPGRYFDYIQNNRET